MLAYFIELDGDAHVPMYEDLRSNWKNRKRGKT